MQVNYVDMQFIYNNMRDNVHVDIHILHFNIINLDDDIHKLHVDIINLMST